MSERSTINPDKMSYRDRLMAGGELGVNQQNKLANAKSSSEAPKEPAEKDGPILGLDGAPLLSGEALAHVEGIVAAKANNPGMDIRERSRQWGLSFSERYNASNEDLEQTEAYAEEQIARIEAKNEYDIRSAEGEQRADRFYAELDQMREDRKLYNIFYEQALLRLPEPEVTSTGVEGHYEKKQLEEARRKEADRIAKSAVAEFKSGLAGKNEEAQQSADDVNNPDNGADTSKETSRGESGDPDMSFLDNMKPIDISNIDWDSIDEQLNTDGKAPNVSPADLPNVDQEALSRMRPITIPESTEHRSEEVAGEETDQADGTDDETAEIKPQAVQDRSYVRRGMDRAKRLYEAAMVKTGHTYAKLGSRHDRREDETEEEYNNRMRKVGTRIAIGVVAVAAAGLAARYGIGTWYDDDDPGRLARATDGNNGGDSGRDLSANGGESADGAGAGIDTDDESIEDTQETNPEVVEYTAEQRRIDSGQGLFETFERFGVPAESHQELLEAVGSELVEIGAAYEDESIGGYGINMTENGQWSDEALDIIHDSAVEEGLIESANEVSPEREVAESAPESTEVAEEPGESDLNTTDTGVDPAAGGPEVDYSGTEITTDPDYTSTEIVPSDAGSGGAEVLDPIVVERLKGMDRIFDAMGVDKPSDRLLLLSQQGAGPTLFHEGYADRHDGPFGYVYSLHIYDDGKIPKEAMDILIEKAKASGIHMNEAIRPGLTFPSGR